MIGGPGRFTPVNPQAHWGWHVIDNPAKLAWLKETLARCPGPYGIDTECIVDIDRSPVLQGRIVCWSIAWHHRPGGLGKHPRGMELAARAFLWADTLPDFKEWLEDPNVLKVGHNVFTFDRHMFLNHGIKL